LARPRIGYVPQSSDVQWDFPITVREVVGMGLYRRTWGLGRFRPPRRDLVDRALERMDALDLASRQPGELSGGQRRRVLLARALVRDPDLLLLDEPAAGLDQPAEEELLALLRGLADAGKTVVVATHDIAGAFETFDLALLLNRKVIAFGPARDTLTDAALHETFGRQLLSFHGHHRHDVELHRHEDI
jgi:manganese/zinc/iron transport system ATP- binding protein